MSLVTRGMSPRPHRHSRAVAVALIVPLLATACSGSSGSSAPASTAAPVVTTDPDVPSTEAPGTAATDPTPDPTVDTTPAPDTTDGATSTPPTVGSEEPSEPATCAWVAEDPAAAAVTFTRGGRLLQVDGNGALACLTEVAAEQTGPLRWSPDATRLLLGGSTLVDRNGTRDTGYFANNTQVTWSLPLGKALLAPSVNDGTLVWRSSSNAGDRKDVSFLTDTIAADYHSTGEFIVAIGTDETGASGLYLASNRGQNRQQLANVDDPSTTLTDVATDATGSAAYFIHDHGDTYHIHGRTLAGGESLFDVHEGTGDAAQLTPSEEFDGLLAWTERAASGSKVMVVRPASIPEAVAVPAPDSSAEPIGWIGLDLILLTRPDPAGAQPGTLWRLSADGVLTRVATGVDRAAVRVMHTPSQTLLDGQVERETFG